jgi:hypothetical protein
MKSNEGKLVFRLGLLPHQVAMYRFGRGQNHLSRAEQS